jgi:hypothetical protein
VVNRNVPLTYIDAELLDAISGASLLGAGLRITLGKMLDSVDFENREIPSYDQVSYGLARLMARGYVTAGYSRRHGIRVRATSKGMDVRRAAALRRKETSPHRWPRAGEYTTAIAGVLDIPLPWQQQPTVISAGRFPRLSESEWKEIVERRNTEFEHSTKRLE